MEKGSPFAYDIQLQRNPSMMRAKVGIIPECGSMLTPIRALVLSAEKMLVFMKRNSRILFLGLMVSP